CTKPSSSTVSECANPAAYATRLLPSYNSQESWSRSMMRHQPSSSGTEDSDQPCTAVSAALISSSTADASSSVACRTLTPSGGDELIQRVWQPGQVGQLASRCRLGTRPRAG